MKNTKIYHWEWPRSNTVIDGSTVGAFGCSHTWGVGVGHDETWPWLLGASNFGFAGGSLDFITRNINTVVTQYKLTKIYVLYPHYSRFEYLDQDGYYTQSLATDGNRYQFKAFNEESWLVTNHKQNKIYLQEFCKNKNLELIDLELDDLHPYIDYPDRWPRAADGQHFNKKWHTEVAEIFRKK